MSRSDRRGALAELLCYSMSWDGEDGVLGGPHASPRRTDIDRQWTCHQQVGLPSFAPPRNDWAKRSHTRASDADQYNLLPASG